MSARPRVMLVSPVSDFKGGAEVVLRGMLANPLADPVLAVPGPGAIADAADAMGIPVCFYLPGAMMKVHRPPRPGPIAAAAGDLVRCAFRLRRLAREHGCDILHSNGLKAHMLCAIVAPFTRIRTLVHLHDIPYRQSERAIWRAIAASVTKVIMVSRPCFPGDRLPANVKVLRNGIAPLFDTLPPARVGGPLRLGFVGRYHPNKGLDLLLDWFGAVRAAGVDATLAIRGRPDPDLPEYWPGIQRRIEREGLSPWVKDEGWTTGTATYAKLDVLLITSQIPDPAPLVVLEAMSAGVIVAGYPAGGIPSMIDDGRTGLFVTDGATLASKLQRLIDDPAALDALRNSAFQRVREDFSLSGFHERLRATYDTMLGRPDHFQ